MDAARAVPDDLSHMSTAEMMLKVADSFKAMKDPAGAGRTGPEAVRPLRRPAAPRPHAGRRRGCEKLLDEQKKAGNYLDRRASKQVQENIKQQRALEAA